MSSPDLDLSDVAAPAGRSAACRNACMAALQADANLTTAIGGPGQVVTANADMAGDVQLVVEVVAMGTDPSGTTEPVRPTVELVPFITPAAHRLADDEYLETVCDLAVEAVSTGIGPGWAYLGATDDFSAEQPRSAEDIEALMQYSRRVQFRAVRTGLY